MHQEDSTGESFRDIYAFIMAAPTNQVVNGHLILKLGRDTWKNYDYLQFGGAQGHWQERRGLGST